MGFGVLVAHAQTNQQHLSSEGKKLFDHVTVVRVVVKQTYKEADKVSLPFYGDAEKLLRYAGFKVVRADSAIFDATLYFYFYPAAFEALCKITGQISEWTTQRGRNGGRETERTF